MIVIYGKDQCSFCTMAKNLCEMKEVEYEYKKLGRDFTQEEFVETFPGARTFPQIIKDGKNIGGFQELRVLI